jgi:hypothetical protein
MEAGKSLELSRSASKFDSLAWVVSVFLGVIDGERRKAMKPHVLLAAEAYEIYVKRVYNHRQYSILSFSSSTTLHIS